MEPFCFVAEKHGRCLGVCAPDKSLLANFYSEFVGCEIKSLPSRDDWISYRDTVPFGTEEPANDRA
jgi:hypothetical protein